MAGYEELEVWEGMCIQFPGTDQVGAHGSSDKLCSTCAGSDTTLRLPQPRCPLRAPPCAVKARRPRHCKTGVGRCCGLPPRPSASTAHLVSAGNDLAVVGLQNLVCRLVCPACERQ